MANRAQPIGPLGQLGAVALLAVLACVLVPLWAVLRAAGWGLALAPADWAAIRFTLWQAALSAGLSVLLAIPVARALIRRRFRGRSLVIALMGAPFVLPVIVAVMGLLAVFGRAGLVNELRAELGLDPWTIYGPQGVILAHLFFNLPLAVRLILQGWQGVPQERIRLAQSLGLGARGIWRHIEWPLLRAVLPAGFLIIFLLCCSSFAVALILGGGPRATTIELAIYQAFRFDFDLARAAMLALIQAGLCLALGALILARAPHMPLGTGLDRPLDLPKGGALLALWDALVIAMAGAFLVLPLAMVLIGGLPHLVDLPDAVWRAAGRSLAVAASACLLALALALPSAALITRARGGARVEALGLLALAVSPLALGTGLFLILHPHIAPQSAALPVTVAVNALMALPFILRILAPAFAEAEASQSRLAAQLGLRGYWRFRHAILPRLWRPLGFAAGVSLALSMGDLGVIALFSAPDQATLPLEMMRLMGAYRMDDAKAAAVLLMLLSFGLFYLADRGGRIHDRA